MKKNLSLIQRLWLLLLLLVFLSVSGALLANLYNARSYLEQQLTTQNANTANSLALMITQYQADHAMAETLINASFDQGHFRIIRWEDGNGTAKVERINPVQFTGTPQWFRRLLPLAPEPGVALISAGWLQAGRLRVETDLSFAYGSLWKGALQTMVWLLAAGLLSGLLGSIDIVRLRRELGHVVEQAQAISEQRFILIPEPHIPELANVAHAMNHMVERLRAYLHGLSNEIDRLRQATHTDATTGLANREALQQAVQSLFSEDEDLTGYLLLVRIANLAELNQRQGGPQTDKLLRKLAEDLATESVQRKGWVAARLRGADFALFAPELGAEALGPLADRLCSQMTLYHQMGLCDQVNVGHIGASVFTGKDKLGELLGRASRALTLAEAAGPNQWRQDDGQQAAVSSDMDWRALIQTACDNKQLNLRWYQVVDVKRQPLWQEAMLYRPAVGDEAPINALRLVSHALRLGLTHRLDLAALRLALAHGPAGAIAVNMSPASLGQADFLPQVQDALRGDSRRISFEFDETGLDEFWQPFLAFSRALKSNSHRIAVEIQGNNLGLVARLNEAGIDYLVLDSALTRGIHADEGRQALLKGLQKMTSLMGIELVAKGLSDNADVSLLTELGIYGLTGPAIS